MEETKPQNPIQMILGDISVNLTKFNNEISELKNKVEILANRESISVDEELQKFKNELDNVTSELDKKYLFFLENFKNEISEKSNITISINKTDKKDIEGVNRIMKSYWYLPLIVMILGLLIMLCTGILATEFYKKSISTKQRVIYELRESGQIILPKEELDEYNDRQKMIQEWRKRNPKDSKSLNDFEKGWKGRELNKYWKN